jgi:hypothetical protein
MKKRPFNKIRSNLKIRFFCSHSFCAGTVKSLSENAMFIETKMTLPIDRKFDVVICLREKLIKVPVRLRKLMGNNKSYDIMAVEVLNPQKDYLEFIDSISPSYKKKKMTGPAMNQNNKKERLYKKHLKQFGKQGSVHV